MSNIFYSNVDENLRKELNARGLSGFRRTTADLDFMLGKIANVEIFAYKTGSSADAPIATIGGRQVREGRFLPNKPDGFLANTTYSTSSIIYTYAGDTVTGATTTSSNFTDTTNRVGPYITGVDITIGDHSMGLLNKATVNMVIPNPQRDLDTVEDVWFRPGRYAKIEIHHPNSAVITSGSTDGRLTTDTLPNTASLKQRYPEWDIDKLLAQINRMNVFSFEGLITSFEFSYTVSGQVEASLSLTGTSNSYTDVSMYTSVTDNTSDTKTPKSKYDPKTQTLISDSELTTNPTATNPPKSEFYDVLDDRITRLVTAKDPEQKSNILINADPGSTDRFILVGQPYSPDVNDAAVQKELNDLQNQLKDPSIDTSTTASLKTRFAALSASAQAETDPVTHYNRYITLGELIHFTNSFITSKFKATEFTQIICDDSICYSNYMPYLTSCIPDTILLLPEFDSTGDMNHYGPVVYYQDVVQKSGTGNNAVWPGVYTKNEKQSAIFTSRIFINVEEIQRILTSISANNTRKFTVDTFLTVISARITYATGGTIKLHLVSHPDDPTKLLFTDVKYISAAPSTNTTTAIGSEKPVVPYSIPMMANHPNGTIVREFRFSATLPESVKNLSYVLNQGDEITEQEIAPYMNFMYSSKDPVAINNFIASYKTRHESYLQSLTETKIKLGLSPTTQELQEALYKALNNYIKYPTPDVKRSQTMIAPILPFTVEFEIDGINGLRYGDVLTFDMLPSKYRVNTVFSIIGITHTVSNEGVWTTNVRCIMRPKID
jgi:hypothetical protein